MGDKYILELEDKPLCVFDEDTQTYFPRLHRVKGFNSLVFDQNGLNNLTPYTEPDMEKIREEAYEKGLADAWKAARKIALMDTETSENVTGYFGLFRIMENLTPMQAIEKIRQYEQEKEEIKVGDEVRNIENGWIAVVCNIEGECMTLMDTNGALGDGYHVNRFTKTGRRFPEIAAILAKMKEES